MDATDTATCRYRRQTITRAEPTPFAELVRHAKPADWTDEAGQQLGAAAGTAGALREPERRAKL
jgi:hypothetical protein